MNETEIQNHLFREFRSGSEIIMPNYTPRAWWESDIWRVTKAGFAYEYEIKLSASDFRADLVKRPSRDMRYYAAKLDPELCARMDEDATKHEILGSLVAYVTAPKRFYFVMPQELVDKVGHEIPQHAGLMIARKRGRWITFKTEKTPIERRSPKVDDKEIARADRASNYRMWNQRTN